MQKNIALGISLSLLNRIFTMGPPFREQVLHLEALKDILLNLISPQTHGIKWLMKVFHRLAGHNCCQ